MSVPYLATHLASPPPLPIRWSLHAIQALIAELQKKEFSLKIINRLLMSTGSLRCPGGLPRPTTALPQPHSQRQGNRRLKEISYDPKISQLSPVWSVSSQSHPIWTIQPSQVCQMPRAALEEARTAYGTDEDVIFIFPSSSEQWFGNFHFSCYHAVISKFRNRVGGQNCVDLCVLLYLM